MPNNENRNYQLEMEREIAKIRASGRKPRLVLHACCAPCSSAVLERLTRDFEIIVYFDNPNISPQAEFIHRAEELKRLIREMPLEGGVCAEIAPYDSESFYEAVRGHENDPETGGRCTICYELRLRGTARYAASIGADYFTTTLSISPLKDARRLNAIGARISAEFGVPYLYSDFKKKDGYRRSCALSAQYNLYRQDFCGCVFSREQRHPEIEDAELIRARLLRPHTIELHDEIDSTNTRARHLAQNGAAHGTAVIADLQTAGRGRFDRKFHSPAGTGVYMSVILRENLSAEGIGLLTPMAAVAVARAIRTVAGLEAQIKWVNDVYLNGKKVCGILCESALREGKPEYVVIGIGVNAGAAEFPEELRGIATSIQNESGRAVSRSRLIAEILNEMDVLAEDPQSCMEEYRARSSVLGKRVTVYRGADVFEADAVAIDDAGNLIVRAADGLQTLCSGEISVRAV